MKRPQPSTTEAGLQGAACSKRAAARRSCSSTAPAGSSRRQPVPRPLAAELSRVRARAARLRRFDRRRPARGHARLRAARLGRGRRARPRAPAPRRPLDGRHDRRRDGGHRAQRPRQARADRAAGPVDRRASDPGPLRDAAAEFPKYLFHDPEAGQKLLTGGLDFSNLEVLAEFYIANTAHGDGRQDPLPDPEPPPLEAALSRRPPRRCSSGGPATADRRRLRRALEEAHPGRGCADRRKPVTWCRTSNPRCSCRRSPGSSAERAAGRRLDRQAAQAARRPPAPDRRRIAFVDDMTPPGCLHVALLRSPHAHARIAHLDVEARAARPAHAAGGHRQGRGASRGPCR